MSRVLKPERLAEIGRFFGAGWTAADYLPDGQEQLLDEAHHMGRELLLEIDRIKAVAADAWDEGVRAGKYVAIDAMKSGPMPPHPTNPYRASLGEVQS